MEQNEYLKELSNNYNNWVEIYNEVNSKYQSGVTQKVGDLFVNWEGETVVNMFLTSYDPASDGEGGFVITKNIFEAFVDLIPKPINIEDLQNMIGKTYEIEQEVLSFGKPIKSIDQFRVTKVKALTEITKHKVNLSGVAIWGDAFLDGQYRYDTWFSPETLVKLINNRQQNDILRNK